MGFAGLELNRMLKSDQYIDRVKDLPPAPTVATELLGLFGDPNHDMDRIVDLIGHDQSLTVEVLRRCNSASFRGAEPALDMFDAITRLGFYEVYCVVAALVGARAMSCGKTSGGADAVKLWRHSVVTAVSAATLAKRLEEPEAVAFTSGLLHDIGKQVFHSVEGPAYSDLLRRTEHNGGQLAEVEKAAFGVNHAEIGGRLLSRWGLPGAVAAATTHHHDSPKTAGEHESLAAMVSLANNLAYQIVDQAGRTPNLESCHPDSVMLMQLSPNEVEPLVAEIKCNMERVQSLLDLAP